MLVFDLHAIFAPDVALLFLPNTLSEEDFKKYGFFPPLPIRALSKILFFVIMISVIWIYKNKENTSVETKIIFSMFPNEIADQIGDQFAD